MPDHDTSPCHIGEKIYPNVCYAAALRIAMVKDSERPIAAILVLALAMLWIGLLAGVSFLATPAKFLAPSLTLSVALEMVAVGAIKADGSVGEAAYSVAPVCMRILVLFRTVIVLSFLCLVGVVTWALYSVSAEEEHGFLKWRDPSVTASGRTLYAANCAGCHGMPDGSATPTTVSGKAPPLHNESGHTWQHPDYALFRLVRDGIAVANCVPVDPELMPRFKGIVSDAELVAILSYIKSTWPESIHTDHDQVNMMYGPYNRAVQDLIEVGEPG